MRYLLAATLLLSPALAGASPSQAGYAARYSTDRLMWRAAEIHGVRIPAGRVPCVSLYRKLGTPLIVRSRVKGREGRFIRCTVADVAAQQHEQSIARRGIVAELTPSSALYLCGTIKEPPSQCKVTVTGG